ncbi:OprD family outer membrane porin [Pseudomonas moorei]|uniref:OprD family outer membrane porin n=1 Tax=Pseudomonas moorei TaxID=395599 RepID=UPI001FDEBDAF|nr:OprD family outer membrane porin [Pseudomonas moorei]
MIFECCSGGRRISWLQGFRLDFVSGFTDGPVKFGLDLSTFSAVALERLPVCRWLAQQRPCLSI